MATKKFSNYYSATAYAYELNKQGNYTRIVEKEDIDILDGGQSLWYEVYISDKKKKVRNNDC